MKIGQFSEFFVTFVVKKNDETKEFRYNYRGQSFSLRSRELQKFSVSQMISAKFFDAQMSKYTFKACFFLKYIRQTHVFFRYPRTTYQSYISSARYSNQQHLTIYNQENVFCLQFLCDIINPEGCAE